MSDALAPDAARRLERRALRLSTIGYVLMAALGIGFAIATRSEAILLDGVYSLIAAGVSLAAIRVARLVDRPSTDYFHFGFAHLEPLLNTLRGFLILAIAVFALVSALDALLHGGRPIGAGLAVIYGGSAAALCLLMSFHQKRLAGRVASPLLQVDARNWLVDGLVSLGAGLAFLGGYLIQGGPWGHLTPYVDPLLVTALVVVLAPIPVYTVWESLREVLQVAPGRDVQADVRERVKQAVANLPTRDVQVRMVKVGRFFYVLTHLVFPGDWKPDRVSDLDAARTRVARALDDVPLRLITDTVFTADERWVIGGDPGPFDS